MAPTSAEAALFETDALQSAYFQPVEHLTGFCLLDGREHNHALEALVAERQEVEQAGPWAGLEGVVDQGALEVERQDRDAHPLALRWPKW